MNDSDRKYGIKVTNAIFHKLITFRAMLIGIVPCIYCVEKESKQHITSYLDNIFANLK